MFFSLIRATRPFRIVVQLEMPRYSDASIVCLKRVMLSRAPEFQFNPTDVIDIAQKTGLSEYQITQWGDNFRKRFPTEKGRLDFLLLDGSEKVF